MRYVVCGRSPDSSLQAKQFVQKLVWYAREHATVTSPSELCHQLYQMPMSIKTCVSLTTE